MDDGANIAEEGGISYSGRHMLRDQEAAFEGNDNFDRSSLELEDQINQYSQQSRNQTTN